MPRKIGLSKAHTSISTAQDVRYDVNMLKLWVQRKYSFFPPKTCFVWRHDASTRIAQLNSPWYVVAFPKWETSL